MEQHIKHPGVTLKKHKSYKLIIIYTISILLIALFLFSVLTAMFDYTGTLQKMEQQVFPIHLAGTLVQGSILLQGAAVLFLGTGLFLKRFLKIGLVLSILILAIYTSYTELVIINAFDRIPCACIHFFQNMSWMQALIFNSSAMALSIFAFLLTKEKPSILKRGQLKSEIA